MRRVGSAISVQEHEAIMMHVRCGNYESEAESLFRYVAHNYGARHQAYLPIVGSGEASALLHVSAADRFASSSQASKEPLQAAAGSRTARARASAGPCASLEPSKALRRQGLRPQASPQRRSIP